MWQILSLRCEWSAICFSFPSHSCLSFPAAELQMSPCCTLRWKSLLSAYRRKSTLALKKTPWKTGKALSMRTLWLQWNLNMKQKEFCKVPAFPHKQPWRAAGTELSRRKLFLLLSLCSALTACFNPEELHNLLVFGRPGPACRSRNPQPTVCLPTSIEQVVSEQPEGLRAGRKDLKEWEH